MSQENKSKLFNEIELVINEYIKNWRNDAELRTEAYYKSITKFDNGEIATDSVGEVALALKEKVLELPNIIFKEVSKPQFKSLENVITLTLKKFNKPNVTPGQVQKLGALLLVEMELVFPDVDPFAAWNGLIPGVIAGGAAGAIAGTVVPGVGTIIGAVFGGIGGLFLKDRNVKKKLIGEVHSILTNSVVNSVAKLQHNKAEAIKIICG